MTLEEGLIAGAMLAAVIGALWWIRRPVRVRRSDEVRDRR